MRTGDELGAAVLLVRVDEGEVQTEGGIDRQGEVGGEQHPVAVPVLVLGARRRTVRGIVPDLDVVGPPHPFEQLEHQGVLGDDGIAERHLEGRVDLEPLLLRHPSLAR